MKNLSLQAKCYCSFGAVLVLLAVVAIWSTTGIKGIVGNAEEVIGGNALRGMLVQNEVDHLNWVANVSALLTDDEVTKLTVEKDHQKCNFGKWLYGEERKEAEKLIPSLKGLFKEIEQPHEDLHGSATEICKVFVQADDLLPGQLAVRAEQHLEWAGKVKDLFLENKKTLEVETDPTQCGLGKWMRSEEGQKAYQHGNSNFKAAWDKMIITHNELHQSAAKIRDVYVPAHEGLAQQLLQRLLDHKDWSEKVAQGIISGNSDLGVQTDPAKCGYGIFLASQEFKDIAKEFPQIKTILLAESSTKSHDALHHSAVAISKAIKSGDLTKARKIYQQETLVSLASVSNALQEAIFVEESVVEQWAQAKKIFDDSTIPNLQATIKSLHTLQKIAEDELHGMHAAESIFAGKTQDALHDVQDLFHNIEGTIDENMMTDGVMIRAAGRTNTVVMTISAIGLILGILLAFIVVRSITIPISKVTGGLGEGAEQVAAASGQVSNSSQSLAEGASEQAASLEETSASLEELSSMTKQNAANASQADGLMKEANTVVAEADKSMGELTKAMEEISHASEETSKIIKTIDEIAFQTNLLALNAAVGAARAGEAGAGFAVVADEVRNLAMRAAEAAKDTGVLIEGTVDKVKMGSSLVGSTGGAFSKVAESTRKVGALVGEISVASVQQDEGISQINTAVIQMDQVTQQNAASAEESASASEELSAQSLQMMEFVNALVLLVEGKNENKFSSSQSGGNERISRKMAVAQAPGVKTHKPVLTQPKTKVDPEKIIPMDEDFEDF